MTVKLVNPCFMGPVLSQMDLCRELQKPKASDNDEVIKELDEVSKECSTLSSLLESISNLVNKYHSKLTS
jgi:hypothetical protein